MSRAAVAVPMMVRLAADLHRQLVKEAAKNGRSLNAEVAIRLRGSLGRRNAENLALADRVARLERLLSKA